jgi:hypothetical protein
MGLGLGWGSDKTGLALLVLQTWNGWRHREDFSQPFLYVWQRLLLSKQLPASALQVGGEEIGAWEGTPHCLKGVLQSEFFSQPSV